VLVLLSSVIVSQLTAAIDFYIVILVLVYSFVFSKKRNSYRFGIT